MPPDSEVGRQAFHSFGNQWQTCHSGTRWALTPSSGETDLPEVSGGQQPDEFSISRHSLAWGSWLLELRGRENLISFSSLR